MSERFLKQTFVCTALLLAAANLPAGQAADVATATNTVPSNVGGVSLADWNTYGAWVASLPADQQAWETLLQKYLGSYYFPIYLKGRLAGKYTLDEPRDWGFVPDDPKLPRVLIIGDSISHMYTEPVRRLLKGKSNVHRAPANCGPTDLGIRAMDDWLDAGSGKKWDVIHFNFGVHDREKPTEVYAANLERIVARLQATGAALVWARTTPFRKGSDAKEAYTRLNDTADAIMRKHGIAIDDVHATVVDKLDDYLMPDELHFNHAGIQIQAEQVAKSIAEALGSMR